MKNNQPTSLLDKDELITDSKEMANKFNEYFCSIAEQLQGRIYHGNHDFSKYLTECNDHNFFIKSTSKQEILNIINKIDVNKQMGPIAFQMKFYTQSNIL